MPSDNTLVAEAALTALDCIVRAYVAHHCMLDASGRLSLPADDIARQAWTLAEAFTKEGQRRHG